MAPQFWRFLPALALASAPLFVPLSQALLQGPDRLPHFDGGAFRLVCAGALLSAGFALYQAPRIDRITGAAAIAGAASLDWAVMMYTGTWGAGALYLQALLLGFWVFIALAIWSSAYHYVHWLRWVALPVLFIASAASFAWFLYEMIFIYAPGMIGGVASHVGA